MHIWCKNSSFQALTNSRMERTDKAVLNLHSAKGGFVSGQILLRSWWETVDIKEFKVIPTGDIPAEITLYLQDYQVYNDGIPYPDRLLPMKPCTIKGNFTQTVVIGIDVPEDAPSGKYSFKVIFDTSLGERTADVTLTVYNVVIPTPKDAALDHEYWFYGTDFTDEYFDFPIDSEKWWKLMDAYAKELKYLRVNVLDLTVIPLLAVKSRRTGKTEWSFDFELLDRFVDRFLALGSFSRIAIHALLDSLTGENIKSFDEDGKEIKLPLRSEEGTAFANCVTSALYSHFCEKGYKDMLLTHIEDEPHESDNWKFMREIIRKNMPDIPCSEPIDEYDSAIALKDYCDEFIPRVDIFEMAKGYFKARQSAGDKLWCYTCCFPLPEWTEYMNKFVDQPSRYSRMLYWTAFANDITGFLHWGFNYWGKGDENVYGLSPDARFKGDGFIVYPDVENIDLFHSNRGFATIEGVEEYELLRLAALKNKSAAKALALRLAPSFNNFNDDSELLENLRVELFRLCEE